MNNVSLGSMTFESDGRITKTVDLSAVIPSGYKIVFAMCRNTGAYSTYVYSFAINSDTSLAIQLYRATGGTQSVEPRATLMLDRIS